MYWWTVVVNNKCFIMAKILQFVRMIWGFISIWFIKFRTYVGKEQKENNELGDILNWQREEVIKLREVLRVEQVLNEKQCINLVEKLDQVVLYVKEMITCTKEAANEFGLVLGELRRITRKVRILVQDCGKQEWCNTMAFQMNNREAFRELVYDLEFFWDAMCEKYLAIDPVSQFRIPCIDFSVATYDEIESDEKALVEGLEKCLEMTPIGSTEYELEKYLLRRLRFKLAQVKGAELDALEIPMNIMKPILLKEIGCGATGMVYKSRWLGLESATKMSRSLSIFHKEACIMASLHHPNFVEVICCGRFNETHEENLVGSRNFFLVMELMEMSLSDLVKKQNMPLPYLVAIDMMHEIARGMCYLHDMHIAHLNLKPRNVLLKSVSRHVGVKGNIGYDFVKLLVSETSKMKPQNKLVLHGYTIGTTQYMAPEMKNVNYESISKMAFPFPADVWSFGMTCSEILSLKKPFPGIYKRDILHKIKDGCRPKLPINCKELTTLIEECWIEDPSQRPTFFDICKRLRTLKRKFMLGVYSNDIPQFGKGWTFSPSTRLTEFFNQMDISVSKKDLGAAGNLMEPGHTKSRTSSNESLDQAQHDPVESLEKLKKDREGSDRRTLTMLRTPQPPIAYTALLGALLGASAILLLWLRISIAGFNPSFILTLFFTMLVVILGQAYAEPMGERSSLDSILSVVNVTIKGYNILPFVLIVAVVVFRAPSSFTSSSFTSSLITSTFLGVGLLMLVLEMRRSVHSRLLWYKATGESLRPCNMLKAQYYTQNLRGALFISKDAPDGCWSYHPDFSLTGQRRENDEDLEDEFEVSGYTYKCRYQYPTSFVDVTMRGKLIKSIETPLELEVHDMFIRLIRRWKRKAEDGVFYGMQIVWGVNVTHCLDVEELYNLLMEGHVAVQYVNGPYTKALVMGEREILENITKVIVTIISFFGVLYANYGGHVVAVVLKGIVLILILIVGGIFIRTLHLSTYMDVESKIFSYKYFRWFKYWEYRGQVLCPYRYCMEVMGHPVHVEDGKRYAVLTRSDFPNDFGEPVSDSMLKAIRVPYFRIEIGKCICSVKRYPGARGYVSFYSRDPKVHDSTKLPYTGYMSETCQERFLTLLLWWGEGRISFVSSEAIKGGQRSAHCTSLLNIFLWFGDDPNRSLDDNPDCHTFRVQKLGYGFENGLWLVHHG